MLCTAMYHNIDETMLQYYMVFSKKIPPLEPPPSLSDFCVPSDAQKNHKIAFIILETAMMGLMAYKLL